MTDGMSRTVNLLLESDGLLADALELMERPLNDLEGRPPMSDQTATFIQDSRSLIRRLAERVAVAERFGFIRATVASNQSFEVGASSIGSHAHAAFQIHLDELKEAGRCE